MKEVGFGMSKKAVEELINIGGVKTIDISGTGGTNFARIENYRRAKDKYDFFRGFWQFHCSFPIRGSGFYRFL